MSQAHDIDPSGPKNEFEQAGREKELSLVQEFLAFVVQERKWWLAPILLALGAAGLMVVLGSTGAAPFIYTLF
jgi:hypothetical protein